MISESDIRARLETVYSDLASKEKAVPIGSNKLIRPSSATVALTADNCPYCQKSGLDKTFPGKEGWCWHHTHFGFGTVREFRQNCKLKGVDVAGLSTEFVPSFFVVSPYKAERWTRQEWNSSADDLISMCRAFDRKQNQLYEETHRNALTVLLLEKFNFIPRSCLVLLNQRLEQSFPLIESSYVQLEAAEAAFRKRLSLSKSKQANSLLTDAPSEVSESMDSLLHRCMCSLLDVCHQDPVEKLTLIVQNVHEFRQQLKTQHTGVLSPKLGMAKDLWKHVFEHCRAFVDRRFETVVKLVSKTQSSRVSSITHNDGSKKKLLGVNNINVLSKKPTK